MSDTAIEWTDKVWNPVTGCTKVSQGCKNCYAERVFPRAYGDRPFTMVMSHGDRFETPLRWRKPCRVFVNSMSDLFHEHVSFAVIPDWARQLRAQCEVGSIPFFFKQWGELSPEGSASRGEWVRHDGAAVKPPLAPGEAQFLFRVGKKAAGRLLDGREWSEYPA